jgi:1,4-alpha-glucan branching enzyme
MVRDLNRLYTEHPALHVLDDSPSGFAWVLCDDATNSVVAFLRNGGRHEGPVLVVINFAPIVQRHYRIGVPQAGGWNEIFNSDADIYGGSNTGNGGTVLADAQAMHGQPASLSLLLPPLAAIVLTQRRA